jgi:flagellar protein FliS
MFQNPITAYQQIGIESDVRGADPHRLIVLLFDGAEVAIARALTQMAAKDYIGLAESVNKANSIILEGLLPSLNLDAGELAHNLAALYDYMARRLLHAHVNSDAAAIREVQGLLGEISGAWREMGEQLRQPQGVENP